MLKHKWYKNSADLHRPTEFFLCTLQLLKIPLHSGCAIFFHTLRNMAVHIQRKCRCGMAQVFLHSFHIIAILEGEDGEGMPKIVNAGIRRTRFPCNLL